MMATILLATGLWVGGGLLLVDSAIKNAADRGNGLGDTLGALRRFDPAALVAMAVIVAIWPVLFVALKVSKSRARWSNY